MLSYNFINFQTRNISVSLYMQAILEYISFYTEAYVNDTCWHKERNISRYDEKCSLTIRGMWIFSFTYRDTFIRLSTVTKTAFTLLNCAWEIFTAVNDFRSTYNIYIDATKCKKIHFVIISKVLLSYIYNRTFSLFKENFNVLNVRFSFHLIFIQWSKEYLYWRKYFGKNIF